MTSLKIKQIFFSDQSSLILNDNDIVIFTGPNNAGKTRSLHDIFQNFHEPGSGQVVISIEIQSENKEYLEPWLKDFAEETEQRIYTGAGFRITGFMIDQFIKKDIVNEQIAKFLSSNLTTDQVRREKQRKGYWQNSTEWAYFPSVQERWRA